MSKILMVGLGGFLGSVFRYGAGEVMGRIPCSACPPLGTLFVNAVGCLLIGLLAGLAEARGVLAVETRLFLIVGLLGGFTTFSTFGLESYELLRMGNWPLVLGNVAAQVVVGLLAVWAGFMLAKLI
ncbi:fluoride efflux transporter CrcB [bacterium]|nr:fluoride efflux transporter CrcB [bacterium]